MLVPLFLAMLTGQNDVGACPGTNPAIVSVAVKNVEPDGALSRYVLSVDVANHGAASQASNTLQSVDIYQDGTKVGQKGVPPLKAGQAYAFPFSFERNSNSPDGTTKLVFALTPKLGDASACDRSGQRYSLKV